MDETKEIYSEEPDIYTTPIRTQEPDFAVNSILWRLAVAVGYAERGQGFVAVDPDEVLELAEDVIWRYKELEK